MKKTVWPEMSGMIHDFNQLEKRLADVKAILACIAWQQEDKTLSVPITALQSMPQGVILDISFDRVHDNYVFKTSLPDAAPVGEGAGLAADDKVASVLG